MREPGLLVGELATLAGLTPRAVRHYEQLGLIGSPARSANGYRRYPASTLAELAEIRRLRELGLSLGDIAAVRATLADGQHERVAARLNHFDAELAAEVERITRQRESLEEVRRGLDRGEPVLANPAPRSFLPVEALLRSAGATKAALDEERRVWAVLEAIDLPADWRNVIADGLELFAADPTTAGTAVAVLELFAQLRFVEPDDPSVERVGRQLAEMANGGSAGAAVDLLNHPAFAGIASALLTCFSEAQLRAFVILAGSVGS